MHGLSLKTQATDLSYLTTSLARDGDEILEVQRLRYQVCSEEMGAHLSNAEESLYCDAQDNYCEHLLMRESDDNNVVGTYRILSPGRAKKFGGYFSQTEFDLSRLQSLSDRMVEIGRACVQLDYRDTESINFLWGGLAQYMQENNHEYLIGCESISMADGGHEAASLYRKLCRIYSAPIEYTVYPHRPLPLYALNQYLDVPIPPLLKGYLRMGAYLCGEPSFDPEFNTANFLILLPMSRMGSRYARRFVK